MLSVGNVHFLPKLVTYLPTDHQTTESLPPTKLPIFEAFIFQFPCIEGEGDLCISAQETLYGEGKGDRKEGQKT